MYDYGYNYDYSYDYGSAANVAGGFLLGGVIMWIIGMAVGVFLIISMWKLFTKAGRKGWAAIVPVYSIIVMLEIAELPMWYLALFLIPFANIYAMFKVYIEIAHKFGKSTGFGVGMVFLSIVFIPMLAFGKDEYKGGNAINLNNLNNSNINSNMQNNTQVNVPNNNFVNVMDVNNGINIEPVNSVNKQNNRSAFQPIGNVNNNVQNMNVSNISSINSIPVSLMNNVDNPINVQPIQENNPSVNINQKNINTMKSLEFKLFSIFLKKLLT